MKTPQELQKFAVGRNRELIEAVVRHCAKVCANEHLDDPVAGTSDGAYDAAVTHCEQAILAEFGLKP